MPRVDPFRALRYSEGIDLSVVTAPPYDVITPDQRDAIELRHPNNVVKLTLGEAGAPDPEQKYRRTGELLAAWLDAGVLVQDAEPSMFLYRCDHDAGSWNGVVATMQLEALGEGGVHGHEATMPEPKADRLACMRATRANLEPLWFLAASPLRSLAGAGQVEEGPALADVKEVSGERHRLWRLPGEISTAFKAELAGTPVVVADGHHRYETALFYRDEMRRSEGAGSWDRAMVLISAPGPLAPPLLPTHRVVWGVDPAELAARLGVSMSPIEVRRLAGAVAEAGAGNVGLYAGGKGALARVPGGLDTVFVGDLVRDVGGEVTYVHDLAALEPESDPDTAVFLLAPVPLEVVLRDALRGGRMPPKTTLFWPKPLTGLVMRLLVGKEAFPP